MLTHRELRARLVMLGLEAKAYAVLGVRMREKWIGEELELVAWEAREVGRELGMGGY